MTISEPKQTYVIRCPSCGQPNQPTANYCPHCGTRLAVTGSLTPDKSEANYCYHCGARLTTANIPQANLALAGLSCPKCKIQSRPGLVECEFCGTNLLTGQADVASDEPEALETKKVSEYLDKITRRGDATFNTQTFLSLQIEGIGQPLTLRVQQKRPLMFGRSAPRPDEFVIDLTPYGAHDKGVSRRHAAIERDGNNLFLWDISSSNGTYLNGIRLTPLQLHQVHDGDEICLGRLLFHVHFHLPASTP